MSRTGLLLLTIAILMSADPALAQMRDGSAGPPSFSVSERGIIERNAALKWLVESDPWVVRRAIDAMAAIDAPSAGGAAQPEPRTRGIGPRDPAATIDPLANPDLNRLQLASPEAAYDLFQLLKQAGSGKPQAR
jgi:hypothetical protein